MDDTKKKKEDNKNKVEEVREVGRVEKDKDQELDEKQKFGKQLEDLEQKCSDLENKYRRALADYQNLEKRVREERITWVQAANKDLLLKILPILDTLMMASVHSQDQSLKISVKQFLDVLKSEGVEKIETAEKTFDPNTMEAIGTDEGEEGKVISETRSGYRLHDKVLRTVQVIVGQRE